MGKHSTCEHGLAPTACKTCKKDYWRRYLKRWNEVHPDYQKQYRQEHRVIRSLKPRKQNRNQIIEARIGSLLAERGYGCRQIQSRLREDGFKCNVSKVKRLIAHVKHLILLEHAEKLSIKRELANSISDSRQLLALNGQRQCIRCKVIKPFSEYAKNNNRKDGLQRVCRTCSSQMQMLYRKLKPFNPHACSIDGKTNSVTGHHPDYSKPWQVVWVCASCHTKLHNGMTFDQSLIQDYSDKIKTRPPKKLKVQRVKKTTTPKIKKVRVIKVIPKCDYCGRYKVLNQGVTFVKDVKRKQFS